jgi:hypothetical protein
MKSLWAMAVLLSVVSAAMAADTGNYIDVMIGDSSNSIYKTDDWFAEVDSIANGLLDADQIGDPQMDLLAKDLDDHMLHMIPGAEHYEADPNNDAIGIAHISWLSRESMADNLTIVTSLSKFIQIWGNSTQRSTAGNDATLIQGGSNNQAETIRDSTAFVDASGSGYTAPANSGNTKTVIQDRSDNQVITAQDSVADAVADASSTDSTATADLGSAETEIQDGSDDQVTATQDSVADVVADVVADAVAVADAVTDAGSTDSTATADAETDITASDSPDSDDTTAAANPSGSTLADNALTGVSASVTAP